MQLSQAVEMLSGPYHGSTEKQVWADLGCGSGTFTQALAHHLPAGSRIIAVDKDRSALQKIPDCFAKITIDKRFANFEEDDFIPDVLDGILMANSLHFVQHQIPFINKAKRLLKPHATLLIVEYDMDSPNPWVPYPVSYDRLKKLFADCGFTSVKMLQ